jgi:hypothetical protein
MCEGVSFRSYEVNPVMTLLQIAVLLTLVFAYGRD